MSGLWEETAEPMRGFVSHVGGIRVVFDPPGDSYRQATGRGIDTAKAIILHFDGAAHWFAKVNCLIFHGCWYAKVWAINSARSKSGLEPLI